MNWKEVVSFMESRCPDYISESGKKLNNGYARGFVFPSGLQLAVETKSEGERTNIWIEDCGYPPIASKSQLYTEEKTRIGSLSSVAPRLTGPGYGKPPQRAYKILVKGNRELEALFDWYSGLSMGKNIQSIEVGKSTMKSQKTDDFSPPLNQILYGPPGTGKTYSVVLKAMSIVDGIDYSSEVSTSDYANFKSRYDELCMKGQIAFVTFHQSYGYEDFIEGIRPRTDGQMISYEVRDGILKTISLRAMKNWLKAAETHKNSIDDVDMFEKSFQLFEEALDESHDGKEKITLYRGGAAELEMGAMGRSVVVSLPGYKTTFNLPKSQLKKLWVRREEIKRPADTKLYNSSFFWAVLEHLKNIALKVTKIPPQAIEQEELKPFFLVIDEINRGNISKIFGELITLIEDDKRIGAPYEMRVTLPYSQEDEDPFGLPPNLYILGTMNTSDRSIALLDTALRRRFEFEEIRPDPSTLKGIEVESGINLSEMLSAMNERIEYLYDRDHTIGHAYFINVKSLSDLETVFRRKIIPLLQEYFYEDWAKVRLALNDKDGSFIEEKNCIPKGLESFSDGYGSKSRYIVRDTFTVDAYRKIYA